MADYSLAVYQGGKATNANSVQPLLVFEVIKRVSYFIPNNLKAIYTFNFFIIIGSIKLPKT